MFAKTDKSTGNGCVEKGAVQLFMQQRGPERCQWEISRGLGEDAAALDGLASFCTLWKVAMDGKQAALESRMESLLRELATVKAEL